MNEQTPKLPDEKSAVDNELLLSFEIAPNWARVTPEAHHVRYQRGGDAEEEHSSAQRGQRRGFAQRDGQRQPRQVGDSRDSRDSRRDRRDKRAPERGVRPSGGNVRHQIPAAESVEQAESLAVTVRILPEQKALSSIIKRIMSSRRAYPLRDIAKLFLDKPASCLVRVDAPKDGSLQLFQCRVCGLPALSEDEVKRHILASHLEDFFEVVDVEGEAPSGNFTCVARCGLTGELLGPPNHHSFNTRVQELLRTRFPQMTPDEYHSRVEMVREPETIEQWREQARRRRLYRIKSVKQVEVQEAETDAPPDAGEASQEVEAVQESRVVATPPMERQTAELHFMREILPHQIATTRHVVATVDVAIKSPSRRLDAAIRDMLNREDRFPASLFFALRGAFRHRKLHIFKIEGGRTQEFVMATVPEPLDTSHAVAELRAILSHLAENQACTRQELLKALAGESEEQYKHLNTQLNWLVEKGHIIEYYNQVLSMPVEYPHFRRLPSERNVK